MNAFYKTAQAKASRLFHNINPIFKLKSLSQSYWEFKVRYRLMSVLYNLTSKKIRFSCDHIYTHRHYATED